MLGWIIYFAVLFVVILVPSYFISKKIQENQE